LSAAMELLLEVGVEDIATELLRKRTLLIAGLQQKGWTILQASSPAQHASAIVSFWREGVDMAALWQKLEAARIVTSLRTDRAGQQYIRLSPHFYNTDAELHRVFELV